MTTCASTKATTVPAARRPVGAAIALAALLCAGCASSPPERKMGANGVPIYQPWHTPWWQISSPNPAPGIVHQTLVDPAAPGYDAGRFATDNSECNTLARQRSVGGAAADGAVGGALAGALLGGIVGHAYGETGAGAGYGAALGGATGGLQGAGQAALTQDQIVRECMRGRGYRVLN